MRKILAIILLFAFHWTFAKPGTNPLKAILTGRITDKKTGEPLVGVDVYIPDLKTGTTSDVDGNYKIENLPESKVRVQVTYIGYNLITETIDLATTKTKDFALEEAVTEINEVVVTGLSSGTEKNRAPTPISTIPQKQLLEGSATNIIDAIASQPGISQLTTGAGISKPVIRGLGYNRVVVVKDGIRQEGQQWGDEHGIEIDEFSVNKVEILKGPASLSYGSDAMAGVINMLTAPTLPSGKVQANVLANYQTNNGLMALSGNVAGNLNGLIWDVRYSNKMAHAYQNAYDGYVANSGFRENTLGGIVGINKSWGYSHLHFSIYNMTPGIVEGDRDSATGQFVIPVALSDGTEGQAIAEESDFKSYDPGVPFQKIRHYKAVLNNSFIVGNGSLKASFGFQQNQRQEFGDVLAKDQYDLYFLLNTLNYDLRYILPEKDQLEIAFGVNGMSQTSRNKGIEFLVPAYNLFDVGIFATLKKSYGKLDVSGGLRYDSRMQHGKELYLNGEEVSSSNDPEAELRFSAFDADFSGVSGSIGAAYQITEAVFTKLNLSRGFRAPNIGELGANGVHEGTLRYEVGNPDLKAETSWQVDYALGLNTEHVTAELDLFSNSIQNFIYPRKLNSALGGDSLINDLQVFKFFAADAHLFGGEFSIDIHPHPLDWLHFENSFSYVQAVQLNQPDSTRYLPFTPAPRLTTELRANAKKLSKFIGNAYGKVELENYFQQHKYYAAFGTETETPGYSLLNIGLGGEIVSGKRTLFSLYLSVNNVLDKAYQSHLSRLKYADENNVTGRTGVYNMGRNVSLKVIVPIGLKG